MAEFSLAYEHLGSIRRRGAGSARSQVGASTQAEVLLATYHCEVKSQTLASDAPYVLPDDTRALRFRLPMDGVGALSYCNEEAWKTVEISPVFAVTTGEVTEQARLTVGLSRRAE